MSAIKRKESGKVYHYTSEAGVFGILKSRSLHLRNVIYMNDPREVNYLSQYLESYQERNFIKQETIKKILHEVGRIKGYYDIFIFSTSDDKDSRTLWEGYTKQKYDGFNIGFNIDKLRELLKKNEITEKNGNNIMFVEDGEVIYSEIEKQKIVDENIKTFIMHHTSTQADHTYNTDLMRTYLYLYSVFFKGEIDWSEEKEYRFAIFVEKGYARKISKTIQKNDEVFTYISLSLTDKDIEHPFEEIVVGAKNDFENDKDDLIKLLDSKHYYNELKTNIRKSEISTTSSDK